MDNDDFHYPPGAQPEQPEEPETPHEEVTPEPVTPEPKTEPETPQPETPEEPETPEPEEPKDPIKNKPRSIYHDLKDTKKDLKSTKSELEIAQARVSELEGLLEKGEKVQAPADIADTDADLRKFAEEEGLDADSLVRLEKFFRNRLGGEKIPESVQKTLNDLQAWKDQQLATTQRSQEDQAIDAQAPAVRSQLKEMGMEVHVDTEATAIMAEIKRLAHTPEFHDKSLSYIVWENRAELRKMISPKKASFETHTPHTDAPGATEIDFSNGNITPVQAAQAFENDRPSSNMTFVK